MNATSWLSGRRGQSLAVATGLFGLAVIWFGIVDPARAWFDDRTALLEQRQALLAHMRDLAAGLPTLRTASAAKQGEGNQTTSLLLRGDSDAVAAADLQEIVQKMAADAGASLTAAETLPPAPEAGGWHKVALRISFNAPWPVLMALVNSIEQSRTRILIDDVHFHTPIVVAHAAMLPIQASMVVYGFRPAEPRT